MWFRKAQARMNEEALIPVFRAGNTESAVQFYQRLGFVMDYEHSSGPSLSRTQVFLRRGEISLILSTRQEDGHPGALVYMRVADVKAIADEFNVEVKESPVGSHIELQDPDGNRLRIGSRNSDPRARK